MTQLIVKTKHDDDELDDDLEVFEVEGTTLVECVSKFVNMDVKELEELLRTNEWRGGSFRYKKDKIVFDSDVFRIIYSI